MRRVSHHPSLQKEKHHTFTPHDSSARQKKKGCMVLPSLEKKKKQKNPPQQRDIVLDHCDNWQHETGAVAQMDYIFSRDRQKKYVQTTCSVSHRNRFYLWHVVCVLHCKYFNCPVPRDKYETAFSVVFIASSVNLLCQEPTPLHQTALETVLLALLHSPSHICVTAEQALHLLQVLVEVAL